MADPLLTSLLNGDIIGFVTSCYTSVMGQAFYGFMLLIFFGAIYNRTRSVALCSILWLLLGSAWIVTAAVVSPIAMILVAAGLTGIIFELKGVRGK